MRFEALLFDLDGTLLDTLDDICDSVNETLRHFGYPERTREEVRRFVGNGAAKLIARSLPDGMNTPRFDEILRWYDMYYTAHSLVKTKPYPAVPEVLGAVRDRGIGIAVISNKQDTVVKDLCRSFFGDTVRVAAGDRPGIRRKPEPDTVLTAMKELGASPETSLYIGDSEVDIETARRAGMRCVSAAWGFRDKETLASAGASVILDRIEDLLFWLDSDKM